jgi:hypothetical protein
VPAPDEIFEHSGFDTLRAEPTAFARASRGGKAHPVRSETCCTVWRYSTPGRIGKNRQHCRRFKHMIVIPILLRLHDRLSQSARHGLAKIATCR